MRERVPSFFVCTTPRLRRDFEMSDVTHCCTVLWNGCSDSVFAVSTLENICVWEWSRSMQCVVDTVRARAPCTSRSSACVAGLQYGSADTATGNGLRGAVITSVSAVCDAKRGCSARGTLPCTLNRTMPTEKCALVGNHERAPRY